MTTEPPLEVDPCEEPVDPDAICEPAVPEEGDYPVRGEIIDAPPVEWVETCIVDGVRHEDFVYVDYPANEGTTEWGFQTCSTSEVAYEASVTYEPVTEVPPTPPTLPATGTGEQILATGFIGTVLIILGVFMTVERRRHNNREDQS